MDQRMRAQHRSVTNGFRNAANLIDQSIRNLEVLMGVNVDLIEESEGIKIIRGYAETLRGMADELDKIVEG